MPYITKLDREQLDPVITQLHKQIVNMEVDDCDTNTEDNINYVITRLIQMVYGDSTSTNSANINEAMAVLECAKQEFYRKVAVPYQDQREFENGSIERFIDPANEVVGVIDIIAGPVVKISEDMQ